MVKRDFFQVYKSYAHGILCIEGRFPADASQSSPAL